MKNEAASNTISLSLSLVCFRRRNNAFVYAFVLRSLERVGHSDHEAAKLSLGTAPCGVFLVCGAENVADAPTVLFFTVFDRSQRRARR